MPQIKVGLKTTSGNMLGSFYDPKTNLYLTPTNPVDIVNYDANTDLSGVLQGIFCFSAPLRLYEGTLPQNQVDAYKAKKDILLKGKLRVDSIISTTPAAITQTEPAKVAGKVKENDANLITAKSLENEISNEGEQLQLEELSESNEESSELDEVNDEATEKPKKNNRKKQN